MALLHRIDLIADAQRGGCGLRQKRADFPAGLPAAFADGVRAEDAEGIAVVPADYGFYFFWSHWKDYITVARRSGAVRDCMMVQESHAARRA